MTLLPIVERELRERARWRSTYWVRGGVALLATGIAMFVLMFMATASAGPIGHGMMEILAWLAFPFIVLEGLRNTADSLSAEKREGTLGLLFLTDLKGYDVVLGKFFASSVTSFYALLAMVPALAIPVLLGGVTGAEFWRLVLALINALFFSVTTGTFISAISRDERKAWAGTFALLGLFVIVLPALANALKQFWLMDFSPFTPFLLHSETRYVAASDQYWRGLWIPHAISWTWLTLASVLLPRVWQESSRRAMRRRAPEPSRARHNRNEVLAINPLWWLMSRHAYQRKWLWAIVLVVCVAGITSFIAVRGNIVGQWTLFGCFIAIHIALAVWVAFESCNSFAEARSTGAMELLLSTPLHIRQILRGQHLAVRELFLAPIVLLLAVEVALVIAQIAMTSQGGGGSFEQVVIVLVLCFCLVWFVLDLFAVAEVGMWFGLTSQKPTQAVTRTVLFVLILPLMIAAIPCCAPVAPGLMVAKSVIFFTWAQSKLENEFRRVATERYDMPRAPKWLRRERPRLTMPGT